MIDALQVIINGLLVGLVYGLVAVSFVVIYRSRASSIWRKARSCCSARCSSGLSRSA
jgi:hypothetical protein